MRTTVNYYLIFRRNLHFMQIITERSYNHCGSSDTLASFTSVMVFPGIPTF